MLHDFLIANRADLIARCRLKVSRRRTPTATTAEMEYGVPLFFEQLIKTLEVEQTREPLKSRHVSGPSGGGAPAWSEMGAAAAVHGHDLFRRGFTVDQVVHDYGDLCQAITDLAVDRTARFEIDEFRTLNRCLDNAIAGAVTEFAYRHDVRVAEKHADTLGERLGFLAHQMRDLLQTATLALTSIREGNVGAGGATGALLERSLIGLRKLVDGSIGDVRLTAGLSARHSLISLAEFIAEVRVSVSLEAGSRGCFLTVGAVDSELAVQADRDLLYSAVSNLLTNAVKFTRSGTEVILHAYALADRVLIDVEDHCGGLPPGALDNIFRPFTQAGADRSGLGLGLSICQRSVEANGGVLRARDVPGSGCIFTIDLPRYAFDAASVTAN